MTLANGTLPTYFPGTDAGDVWTPHEVRIRSVVVETHDVRTYELEFADPARAARYDAVPGQFNMLYVPGAGEAAISLGARARDDGRIVHTVRALGRVTGSLARMRAGDSLGLRGPFGAGWPIDACRGRDVLLVAGGIGLAPIRSALHRLIDERNAFGDVTLLYGARTPDDRLYVGEHDDWSKHAVRVQSTVDRSAPGWTGDVGVVTLLLDRCRIDAPADTLVLVCGPEVMTNFVAEGALRRGIPAENVWVSLERNMNCAVGFCGHCQLGPEFVCRDGPVLRYDRVAPFLRVKDL